MAAVLATACPDAQATGCVGTKCHAAPTGLSLHAPVLKDGCASCHPLRGGGVGKHPPAKIVVPAPTRAFCLRCHPAVAKELEASVVHRPAKGIECGFCHQPHASPLRKLLRPPRHKGGVQVGCVGCHSSADFEGEAVHAPLASTGCQACHAAHGSPHRGRLRDHQVALCKSCHKLPWLSRPYRHGPVASGFCASCHNPHSSKKGWHLLRFPRERLCLSCHNKTEVLAQHQGVPRSDAGCETCHDPHASDLPRLMKERK